MVKSPKKPKSTPKKLKEELEKEPSPLNSSCASDNTGHPSSQDSSKLEAILESAPKHDDFDSDYLKQVTAEFADDLDKVRNAGDFSDRSVPILIEALRQGSSVFSEEEKRRVMEGRVGG